MKSSCSHRKVYNGCGETNRGQAPIKDHRRRTKGRVILPPAFTTYIWDSRRYFSPELRPLLSFILLFFLLNATNKKVVVNSLLKLAFKGVGIFLKEISSDQQKEGVKGGERREREIFFSIPEVKRVADARIEYQLRALMALGEDKNHHRARKFWGRKEAEEEEEISGLNREAITYSLFSATMHTGFIENTVRNQRYLACFRSLKTFMNFRLAHPKK